MTEKCLNLEVIVQASSRALRPPFWSPWLSLSSRDLLEPPGDAPEAQKTNTLDRKMPQSESGHRALSQSSPATILELWASPDMEGPPWTPLDTSSSHLDSTREHRKQPDSTKIAKRGIPGKQLRTTISSIGTSFYPPKVDEISINLLCEMLGIFRNYCARSNRSNARIWSHPFCRPMAALVI